MPKKGERDMRPRDCNGRWIKWDSEFAESEYDKLPQDGLTETQEASLMRAYQQGQAAYGNQDTRRFNYYWGAKDTGSGFAEQWVQGWLDAKFAAISAQR